MRIAARALLFGLALLMLSGCEYWVGDRIATLPDDKAWQVLPLKRFLTRPTIQVDAMEFCRVESCGYDAAIGRFTAEAGEAAALKATLVDPTNLGKLVRESRTAEGKSVKQAKVTVEAFKTSNWNGVSISIVGDKRKAFGVMLERPSGPRLEIILVFAGHADVARSLALAAAG